MQSFRTDYGMKIVPSPEIPRNVVSFSDLRKIQFDRNGYTASTCGIKRRESQFLFPIERF